MIDLGKQVLKTERAFNIAAGFTNKHDRLPEFFAEDTCAPHNRYLDDQRRGNRRVLEFLNRKPLNLTTPP